MRRRFNSSRSAFSGDGDKEDAVREAAAVIAAVPTRVGDRGKQPRPKVAVFGDLYSRDNDTLNQGLIHFIEAHGGEVVTLPYSSYVKMVAWPYMRKWFLEGEYLDALTTGATMAAVTLMERRYRHPLEPLIDEPEPVFNDPPEQILRRFGLRLEHTGESMDNLLKVHYTQKYHPDVSLFVQASPAFCCPALITEAMALRIEQVMGVPVVSITYDGIGGNKNDIIVPYLKYPGRLLRAKTPEKRHEDGSGGYRRSLNNAADHANSRATPVGCSPRPLADVSGLNGIMVFSLTLVLLAKGLNYSEGSYPEIRDDTTERFDFGDDAAMNRNG